MTTRTILEKAVAILELDIDLSRSSEARTRLLSCAEYIVQEASSQYVRLEKEETVTVTNGEIRFSTLASDVMHVLSVKKDGEDIPFREVSNAIKLDCTGEVKVRYLYCIRSVSISTSLAFPPAFCEEVFSLGVVGEYLYRIGNESSAKIYAEKYLNAIKNLTQLKKKIVMPKRSYL